MYRHTNYWKSAARPFCAATVRRGAMCSVALSRSFGETDRETTDRHHRRQPRWCPRSAQRLLSEGSGDRRRRECAASETVLLLVVSLGHQVPSLKGGALR
ncbi:hypothetical protein TcasGA2_TC034192 [Tribolium castaneum]|uniref:Uncharacterized protein n=1 Tax=Tribolium castaneum TaxID=7070 RepID=A0A139WCQ0_TRICA|nr:hypothetical protein TcasGA2_TC034192 [Tribolium castaneum]